MRRISHSMWGIVLMSGMCFFGHEALADEKLPINPGFKSTKKVDPKLPRVLLVGDSICGGYKRSVTRMLKNTATVDVWVTGKNLKKDDLEERQRQAMENGPYDVIHFNIGQHGLGNKIASDEYEPLFRKYIATWKKYAPQSKLIWASTTPRTVRENHNEFDPVNNPKIVRRNAIAAKVAKESGIVVNDLYSIPAKHRDLFAKDGIHLKHYPLLAEQISDVIVCALKHDNTEKHP